MATDSLTTRIPTSVANHAQAQSEELPGFEEFTSKSLDHLLRQSMCVGGTSSPSPPKKRKNVRNKKSIPVEVVSQENPVLSPQSPKKSFSTSMPVED